MTPSGASSDLELWLVDVSGTSKALCQIEAQFGLLTADDHARARAISDLSARAQRLAAYTAQRLILERCFGDGLRGVALLRDGLGRPRLPPEHKGSISLAHTGPLALIGVTRGLAIGVDLEAPREVRMSLERRQRIEAAAMAMSASALPLEATPRFLQAWVRLEALAKADGRGIGHILTQIGAVGQPRDANVDAMVGAAAQIASAHGLYVHDMDAGPMLHAALASPSPQCPMLSHLPQTVEGLSALM